MSLEPICNIILSGFSSTNVGTTKKSNCFVIASRKHLKILQLTFFICFETSLSCFCQMFLPFALLFPCCYHICIFLFSRNHSSLRKKLFNSFTMEANIIYHIISYQWTGVYMISASVVKDLNIFLLYKATVFDINLEFLIVFAKYQV